MPLFLDPKSQHRVVLRSDKEKPQADQPAFFFKVLTVRQWRELSKRNAELTAIVGEEKAADHEVETLKTHLLGWENMTGPGSNEIPFDTDRVEEFLTLFEIIELNQALLLARPDFLKKHSSDSPSPSSSESSKTADAAPE